MIQIHHSTTHDKKKVPSIYIMFFPKGNTTTNNYVTYLQLQAV